MGVRCVVYIDQGTEGQPFTFVSVPHEGDKLLIPGVEAPVNLTVDTVTYIAHANPTDELAGAVEIRASSRTLGN